jgi:hypothetical protein
VGSGGGRCVGHSTRRHWSVFGTCPGEQVLPLLANYVKADPAYVPTKDLGSRRWHLRTEVGEFEILTTGAKWYDTRSLQGGGGAIDLAMHVLGLSFVDAVKLLTARVGARGPDHP